MKVPYVILFGIMAFSGLTHAAAAEKDICSLQVVAKKYVTDHFKNERPDISRVNIHDEGSVWIVEYDLPPPGFVGGGVGIVIDKATCTAIKRVLYQ